MRDERVYTAATGVLEGSMRKLVLDACRELSIPVVLEAPKLSERNLWQAAFITSTQNSFELLCLVAVLSLFGHYSHLIRCCAAFLDVGVVRVMMNVTCLVWEEKTGQHIVIHETSILSDTCRLVQRIRDQVSMHCRCLE